MYNIHFYINNNCNICNCIHFRLWFYRKCIEIQWQAYVVIVHFLFINLYSESEYVSRQAADIGLCSLVVIVTATEQEEFGFFQLDAWTSLVPRESTADAAGSLVDGAHFAPSVAVVVPESGAALICAVVTLGLIVVVVVGAKCLATEIAESVVRRHAIVEAKLCFVVVILRRYYHLVVCCCICLQHRKR